MTNVAYGTQVVLWAVVWAQAGWIARPHIKLPERRRDDR